MSEIKHITRQGGLACFDNKSGGDEYSESWMINGNLEVVASVHATVFNDLLHVGCAHTFFNCLEALLKGARGLRAWIALCGSTNYSNSIQHPDLSPDCVHYASLT